MIGCRLKGWGFVAAAWGSAKIPEARMLWNRNTEDD